MQERDQKIKTANPKDLGAKKPGVVNTRLSPCALPEAGEKICALTAVKKLVFRYRQKIFTTNNHYEWSK